MIIRSRPRARLVRLDRAGWVSRHPHPTDRRFVVLQLDAAAQAAADATDQLRT